MLQARQVRLHGVVRGRLSWAARDEARPVDAEQLADVGDVGPEGGDYLAEVLLHALHEPCGLLGAVRQDVRATAFFGILSAMRRLLSMFAVRYYSAFREKSPLFFVAAKIISRSVYGGLATSGITYPGFFRDKGGRRSALIFSSKNHIMRCC